MLITSKILRLQVGLSEFGEVGGVTTTEPGHHHMHAAHSNKSKNHDIIHNNPSDLDHFTVCRYNAKLITLLFPLK